MNYVCGEVVKTDFSDKLKDYRNSKGYTQEEFARIVGFARSTVSEMEGGKRKPTLRAVKIIASKTDTNISDWILEDSEHEIELFDGLRLVIDALVDSGKIDANGVMNEEAKDACMKILEKEVKLYIYEKRG
jgi:transcriptional regulator with XRE-family HTH domain